MAAAARSSLLMLLRRPLPAESERRLRRCLDALQNPPRDRRDISGATAEAGGDRGDISGSTAEAGDGSDISGAAAEAGDGSDISGAKRKTASAGGDRAAIFGGTEETRSVARWFGTTDEYF